MKRIFKIVVLCLLLSESAYANHKETEQKFYGNSYESPDSDKYQKLENQPFDNDL
jgi:hypothetical protein